MTELTEQQKHLQQLLEQHQQLINDINTLTAQLSAKRELALKVLGAIEYIEQTTQNNEETTDVVNPEIEEVETVTEN